MTLAVICLDSAPYGRSTRKKSCFRRGRRLLGLALNEMMALFRYLLFPLTSFPAFSPTSAPSFSPTSAPSLAHTTSEQFAVFFLRQKCFSIVFSKIQI